MRYHPKKTVMKSELINIERKIYLIRGQKVMLDKDLADLYKVPLKRLNQQVKRNTKRFPEDFMFQLEKEEAESLRSQIVTLKKSRGEHRKYLPYVFTEQGVAMLSSVLNSDTAIEVNIAIMRVFVRMRQMVSLNKQISEKLKELEVRLEKHDAQFKVVFEALRRMMVEETKPKTRIGFHP